GNQSCGLNITVKRDVMLWVYPLNNPGCVLVNPQVFTRGPPCKPLHEDVVRIVAPWVFPNSPEFVPEPGNVLVPLWSNLELPSPLKPLQAIVPHIGQVQEKSLPERIFFFDLDLLGNVARQFGIEPLISAIGPNRFGSPREFRLSRLRHHSLPSL